MSKKNLWVFAVLIVTVLLSGVWAWTNYRSSNARQVKVQEIAAQLEELKTLRQEMVGLYAERMILVRDTIQTPLSVQEKLRDSHLDSPDECAQFDLIQNQVSEQISNYLMKSKREVPGLRKIEESLNRVRRDYHVKAFAINERLQKEDLGVKPAPVFAAEKMLYDAGKF